MLDLFHIDGAERVQFFPALSGTGSFHEWSKPRGCRLVYLFGIGGGGGGGGGFGAAAGTTRGGGSGGGSGSTHKAIYQASSLPDVLFIRPGVGGAGGASATVGIIGQGTHVSVKPDVSFTAANSVLRAEPGSPGGAGTTTTSSGGAAGSTTSLSNHAWIAQAFTVNSSATAYAMAGGAGGAGATGAASGAGGSSITGHSPSITTGGSGGGSVGSDNSQGSGGNINVSSSIWDANRIGGIGGGTPNGEHGIGSLLNPFWGVGGTGGGGNNAGTGGVGGDGFYGCGGGGGGAGTSTGGAGGKGGDGFVLIVCW